MNDAEQVNYAALYRADLSSFEEALDHYVQQARDLAKGLVEEAYVTGRVKTARSTIRKIWEDPANPREWSSVLDKVGVRIISSTKSDLRKIDGELAEGALGDVIRRREHKGKSDELFYPGIHYIVQQDAVVDSAGLPLPCEIQLRTKAQDAWSSVSHKLSYKGVIKPRGQMQRIIDRLTVVVEMFDDEIHRLMKKRRRLPMYRVAVAHELVEDLYEKVTGDPTRIASDLSIMQTVLGAYDAETDATFEALVGSFVAAHEDELRPLLAEHQPTADGYIDSRDWLYTEPAILAVLERANARPHLLVEAIRDRDIEDVVRRSCAAVGITLP